MSPSASIKLSQSFSAAQKGHPVIPTQKDRRQPTCLLKPHCMFLTYSRSSPEDQIGLVTICIYSLQLNGALCLAQLLQDPTLLCNAPPALVTAQTDTVWFPEPMKTSMWTYMVQLLR